MPPAEEAVKADRLVESKRSSCESPDGPGEGAGEVPVEARCVRALPLDEDAFDRGFGVAEEGRGCVWTYVQVGESCPQRGRSEHKASSTEGREEHIPLARPESRPRPHWP